MNTPIIPCEKCGSHMEYVFDAETFDLCLLWCKKCNHTDTPIGRERLIKPSFVQKIEMDTQNDRNSSETYYP